MGHNRRQMLFEQASLLRACASPNIEAVPTAVILDGPFECILSLGMRVVLPDPLLTSG